MPINSIITPVSKYGSKIVTCDPTTRRIEAVIKSGAVVQVAVYSVPTFFRWPVVGENWMIRQENGTYILDSLWQEPELDTSIETLAPGEALINTTTGNVQLTTGVSLARKYTQIVGDGSTTTFAIDHNLSTGLVQITALKNPALSSISGVTWEQEDEDHTLVKFGSAPSTNGATVVVIG